MSDQSTAKMPALTGGISTQPAHVRFPGQLAAANNCMASVAEGLHNRFGTRYVKKLTGFTASGTYRAHVINRDASEKYLAFYGASTLIVATIAGVACSVHKLAAAESYLGTATDDQLRPATQADYTVWCNTTTIPLSATSPDYDTTGEARTFEILASTTPAGGTYWQTTTDSVAATPGYWRYLPGASTYATLRFANISGTLAASSAYDDAGLTPSGFKVFFVTRAGTTGITNASIAADGVTLTKTGLFTNAVAGDKVNVTGGTNVTQQYATISSVTSADVAVLTADITTDALVHNDVSVDGIGEAYEVSVDFTSEDIADMHAVAAAYQRNLRAKGATNACISWTPVNTVAGGYMTITHPYAGTTATFPTSKPTRSPSTGVYDVTDAANDPFYNVGTAITAGTGLTAISTNNPLDRWTRVPAPSQKQAIFDPTTMPVRMVRLMPAGTWTGGWSAMTTALLPFAWWRFGEATGTVARDELNVNHGTYVGGTLGATGSVNGDSDTAVTLTAASNQYVNVGLLGTLGADIDDGFTLEITADTTGTAIQALFGSGRSDVGAGAGMEVHWRINCTNRTVNTTDGIWFHLADKNGLRLAADVISTTVLNTGGFHTFHVVVKPSANTIDFYVDGVLQTGSKTYRQQATPAAFEALNLAAGWGGWLQSAGSLAYPANGAIDEAVIFLARMDQAMVTQRHGQRTSSTYSHPPTFVLAPINWASRTTGDHLTNPIPNFIRDGKKIADVAFFQNRFVFLSGEWIVCSQDGDYFNFFIDDATNIVDSDPIERQASGTTVASMDFAVPMRRTLALFTKSGTQFEFTSPDALTPASASITQNTAYATQEGVRPAVINDRAFFVTKSTNYSELWDYAYDLTNDSSVFLSASNVSAHVMGLIPATVRTIAACPSHQTLIVLPSSGTTLYTYRYQYSGGEKVQSAWHTWSFDASYRLCDVAVVDDFAYFLVESQSQFMLEKHALARPAAESGQSYLGHMDRALTLTGVHAAGTTTWTLPDGLSDTTINTIVLGSGTPTGSAGDVLTPTTAPGTTVTKSGNYGGVAALLGRSFTMRAELSRHYVKDFQGRANLRAAVQIRELTTAHMNTGAYTVRGVMASRTDRTKVMAPASGLTESVGTRHALIGGSSDRLTLSIENAGPKPTIITGAEIVADYVPRT